MSVADLAQRENLRRSWISQQLPLAFLAPDIVEAVLDRRQPVAIDLAGLKALAQRHSDWREQRQTCWRTAGLGNAGC